MTNPTKPTEEKKIIKVWKGRAYLHEEYELFGLHCEKDTPIGFYENDYKKLDEYAEEGIEFVFLNDDFTIKNL